MDLDEFRMLLVRSEVGIWALIDTAIAVAAMNHGDEIKLHRDRIVEKLYAPPSSLCRLCDKQILENGGIQGYSITEKDSYRIDVSPSYQKSEGIQSYSITEKDSYRIDLSPSYQKSEGELETIFTLRGYLDHQNQSEESLIMILKDLAAMEITFHALKATDIGRYVNRLRKHASIEIRNLVKQLVRKWKDLVDEWVKSSTCEELVDGYDSAAQQKKTKDEHNQLPDFLFSPWVENSNSGSGSGGVHMVAKNTNSAMKRGSPSEQHKQENEIDVARLASATKRLHQNYQDAENAKKQRTIQVMDINDIPKPRNGFISKNKGHPGRH